MYERKLVTTADEHKLNDAIITGKININGEHLAIGVMDSRFSGSSRYPVLLPKTSSKKVSLHSGEKKVLEVCVNKKIAQKTAWERVMIARTMNRPTSKDYID